jgi:hypothetical protein
MDALSLAGSAESLTVSTATRILMTALSLSGSAEQITLSTGAISVLLDALTGTLEAQNITTSILTEASQGRSIIIADEDRMVIIDAENRTITVFGDPITVYENLKLFSETDPNSKITIAENELVFANVNMLENATVQKDFGVDHFSGDFTERFKIKITSASATGVRAYVWALTNSQDNMRSLITGNGDYLGLFSWLAGGGVYYLGLEEVLAGSSSQSSVAIAKDAEYYISIIRDESIGTYGRLTLNIYSDSARTSLFGSTYLTLRAKKDFRYKRAFGSYASGNPSTISGIISHIFSEAQIKHRINIDKNTIH